MPHKEDLSPRALLIDGSSFIYRAYFAIPGYLATTKGLPTKAIFGVTQMLLKILKEWDPKIIVWFMDEKGPTFRHLKYEEYKATRPAMPEDLQIQIPYIKKIVTSLGIPLVSAEGFEADDLIATFIKTFDVAVLMIAPDKDLLSLISERVTAYDPVRETFMDLDTFKKKYGFAPSAFPHFRSLAGDVSDNIKGVPGIGEKTAGDFIRTYGSIENLYQNLERISPPKLRETLKKYRERVFENLELMKLREDAPLPSQELSFYQRREPNYRELKLLFKELEFRKILKEFSFPELKPTPKLTTLSPKECIDLLKIKKDLPIGFFYVREEKGLFGHNLNKAFLALTPEEIIETTVEPPLLSELKERETYLLDYKNFLKDYQVKLNQAFDLRLASYLLNPSFKTYELSALSAEYLDFTINEAPKKGESQKAKEYSALCATGLYLLGQELKTRLEREGLIEWHKRVEVPLSYVLYLMERHGILIDLDYVKELNQSFLKRIKDLEGKLFELAQEPFNPRSSQEVGRILFEKLKLPRLKKTPKSDLPSTDAEVLEELSDYHPIVPLLLQYRTLYKLKSTYLEVFLKEVSPLTHRLHTEFNQTGTATGRLSSQKPNLQNIPVKGEEGLAIRRAFIAEEGKVIMSLDYSQIELRVLAHFSGDENLSRAFAEGKDIHTFTACEVFGVSPEKVTPEMRRIAKVINFGLAYGMSPYGLSKELKIDVSSAEAYIKKYFTRYPGVKRYIEETIAFAKEKGYVTTLAGRKRFIPEILSPNRAVRELGQRMAINTPIQGSAADLIKAAMVALQEALEREGYQSKIILQVHDELLLEVPQEEIEEIMSLAKEIMENPFPRLGLDLKFSVPIKVNISYGKSWADCK